MNPSLLESLRRAFLTDAAFTEVDSVDPRLRGRTYAIPFDTVWRVSLRLMGGGLKGWSVLEADDREGEIDGLIKGWFERLNSGVKIRVTLDRNAQTRVDAVAATLNGKADLGANARRLGRIFKALDRELETAYGHAMEHARLDPAPMR